jgi:hypothetical protein
MRARYEDLLRVAKRRAIEVGHPGARGDLAAGWARVLKACRQHLIWLRGDLEVPELVVAVDAEPDERLIALARALGAGADLLAAQDLTTAAAFTDTEQLVSARAEVASVTLIAAVAVSEGLEDQQGRGDAESFAGNLRASMTELEMIAQGAGSSTGFGMLAGLTAASPPIALDEVSSISRAAVHWQHAHELSDSTSLLTRDLRSITAQLRTVSGYAWHLATSLLLSPKSLEGSEEQLEIAMSRLRRAQAGAQQCAHSWQRRLSDVGGRSSLPGEVAFKDLQVALDQLLKRDGRLLSPADLVTSRQTAGVLLDALDELVYSAHRVAYLQQYATAGLIMRGRLFVPLRVLVKRDPDYLHRPGANWRNPLMPWARTSRSDCFADLTASLAAVTHHLMDASRLTSELTGTAKDSRPYGGELAGRTPMPRIEAPARRQVLSRGNHSCSQPPSPPFLGR